MGDQGQKSTSTTEEFNDYLLVAAMGWGYEEIQELLNDGANINATDDNGWSALHHVSLRGKPDCVKLLLDRGANIDTPSTKKGTTALHLASFYGKPKCVEILLKFGANPNATDNKYGETALHLASRAGNLKCVEILLKYGADTTIKDNTNKTAFDVTSTYNNKIKAILNIAPIKKELRKDTYHL